MWSSSCGHIRPQTDLFFSSKVFFPLNCWKGHRHSSNNSQPLIGTLSVPSLPIPTHNRWRITLDLGGAKIGGGACRYSRGYGGHGPCIFSVPAPMPQGWCFDFKKKKGGFVFVPIFIGFVCVVECARLGEWV
jgi:hypothetical protein